MLYEKIALAIIASIAMVIIIAGPIIKGLMACRDYTGGVVPNQLAQLIRQAHLNQPFRTEWNIRVSDDMRCALQLPLTPEQIRAMQQAGDDITSRSVNCYKLSSQIKGEEMSGVFKVSFDIESKSGQHTYHFHDVRLRVVAHFTGDRATLNTRWEVTSVEQLP